MMFWSEDHIRKVGPRKRRGAAPDGKPKPVERLPRFQLAADARQTMKNRSWPGLVPAIHAVSPKLLPVPSN